MPVFKLQRYQNTSYRFKNSRILSDVYLTYHISKEDNAQRFVVYANREIDNPCNLKGLRVIKQSLQIRVSFTWTPKEMFLLRAYLFHLLLLYATL
jgi:hypothetical protein